MSSTQSVTNPHEIHSPCPIIDNLIENGAERSKFQSLSPYFKDLTPEDVIKSELSDLVTLVEVEHRVLMNTFVTNYLQPYKVGLCFKKTSIEVRNLRFLEGILDGSGYRIQSSIALSTWEGLEIGQTADIKTRAEELIGNNKINFFDLSGNLFVSQDFKYVYELIDSLKNSLEGCIVNLENNKIHGYDEKYREEVPNLIKKICEIKSVKYLVLFNNPFCTLDRKDYFQVQYKEESIVKKKLIWIPKFLIKGEGWKSLLGNDTKFHQDVLNVHEDFQKEFDYYLRKKYSKDGWIDELQTLIPRNQILRNTTIDIHYYYYTKGRANQNDIDELFEVKFDIWVQDGIYKHNDLIFKVVEKSNSLMKVLISIKVSLLAFNLISGASYKRLKLIQGDINYEELESDSDDVYYDQRAGSNPQKITKQKRKKSKKKSLSHQNNS